MKKLYSDLIKLLKINTVTDQISFLELEKLFNLLFPSCVIHKIENNKKASFIIELNKNNSKQIDNGLLFVGHYDTVAINNNSIYETEDAIFGRGSVDMKYFIVCLSSILPYIRKRHFPFPITLCLSGDEEKETDCVKDIVSHLKQKNVKYDLCVVGEPSGFNICNSHNGHYILDFEIDSISLHSSHSTINQNSAFFAVELINYIYSTAKIKTSISSINTVGVSSNSNPTKCKVALEFRPESLEDIEELISSIDNYIQDKKKDYIGDVTYKIRNGFIPPYYSKCSTWICKIFKGDFCRFPAASEAPFYQTICDEVVVFGAGDINCAHSETEYILKSDLCKYKEKLIGIIDNYNELRKVPNEKIKS